MSEAKDNYILIYWWWDDLGDYKPTFETTIEFIKDKQLDDIKKLMKDFGVKRWVKNPHLVTAKTHKKGDASLVEYRNLEIRPLKIVEAWSYKPEVTNETN